MVVTLDNATCALAIRDLPVGRDDSVFSAMERLFVIANGPTGRLNPQRQGLNSALMDKLPLLNLVGGLPSRNEDIRAHLAKSAMRGRHHSSPPRRRRSS